MPREYIVAETNRQIRLLRISRPEALNAISRQVLCELADAVEEADADATIRGIVLTGSDTVFAAGADVAEMAHKSAAQMLEEDFFGVDVARITDCKKPLIAAVSGFALGGGCELAMLCDFIVADETAKFGQPETKLGVIAGIGGTQRLTHLIGKGKAMEMHLTGRILDADEAERIGLVASLVPQGTAVEQALTMAVVIGQRSMPAVMAAKKAVNLASEVPLETGLKRERELFLSLFDTEDQKEGMAAFLEKRAPRFKDR